MYMSTAKTKNFKDMMMFILRGHFRPISYILLLYNRTHFQFNMTIKETIYFGDFKSKMENCLQTMAMGNSSV